MGDLFQMMMMVVDGQMKRSNQCHEEVILLMEYILHQLIGSLSHYLHGFYTSQVVQDFFHQQYLLVCGRDDYCPRKERRYNWNFSHHSLGTEVLEPKKCDDPVGHCSGVTQESYSSHSVFYHIMVYI